MLYPEIREISPLYKTMYIKARTGEEGKLYGSELQELSSDTKLKCDVFPPPPSPHPQVHVHRRGSDSLLKIIPARILPKEYGEEAGSLLDHWGKDRNVLCVLSTQSDRLWSIIFGLNFTFLSLLPISFPFSST